MKRSDTPAWRSEPIKVGDLVIVVKIHECFSSRLGAPFIVTGLVAPYGGGWTCGQCGQRNAAPNEPAALGLIPSRAKRKADEYPAVPISWLKRIPPLGELGDVQHDEEVTA